MHEIMTGLLIGLLILVPFLIGGSWVFTLGLCFANSIGVLAVSLLVRYGGEVSIGHTFFTALGAYTVGILDTKFGISEEPLFYFILALNLLTSIIIQTLFLE